ncbi:MAG TPA: hypothetical protein VN716_19075 [Vicinamibacterales bacterium]|nr:hypothetical protein [Vicinamibacterales bacterium]
MSASPLDVAARELSEAYIVHVAARAALAKCYAHRRDLHSPAMKTAVADLKEAAAALEEAGVAYAAAKRRAAPAATS